MRPSKSAATISVFLIIGLFFCCKAGGAEGRKKNKSSQASIEIEAQMVGGSACLISVNNHTANSYNLELLIRQSDANLNELDRRTEKLSIISKERKELSVKAVPKATFCSVNPSKVEKVGGTGS